MRKTNRICSPPWNKFELNDPVQLGHGLVLLFPVAVQAHDLLADLVDHQDVGRHIAFGVAVVVQFQVGVDVVHLAQAVFVLFKLAAFNLVVGLLGFGLLDFHRGARQVHVDVHARGDAAIKLPVGDLVDFGCTFGGVEVGGRKGQDHPVDWQELHAWALLLLVVPELEVLGAAQR